MKKLLLCVSFSFLLSLLPIKLIRAEDTGDVVYSSILSEYQSILDCEGTVAAIEYLQAQYALHPECAPLSFSLGTLKCTWDESYFTYTATEEACSYFENGYSVDTTSPDAIWAQGLVAYKNQDYNQALSFMTDFLSYVSRSPDGSPSISPSTGIISCLDQYSTAAFIILNCCANVDIPDDLSSLDMLMTKTHSLLDPSCMNPKTFRRGMQVLYYGVQYAEQTTNTALARRYAQDFVCIHSIIESNWTYKGLSLEEAYMDEMVNYLNETLVIKLNILDALVPYYFPSATF